jgi:hypothetical protein
MRKAAAVLSILFLILFIVFSMVFVEIDFKTTSLHTVQHPHFVETN